MIEIRPAPNKPTLAVVAPPEYCGAGEDTGMLIKELDETLRDHDIGLTPFQFNAFNGDDRNHLGLQKHIDRKLISGLVIPNSTDVLGRIAAGKEVESAARKVALAGLPILVMAAVERTELGIYGTPELNACSPEIIVFGRGITDKEGHIVGQDDGYDFEKIVARFRPDVQVDQAVNIGVAA
ncbi:MAG TPA: hypothetical protein VMU97_01225 [Candidatus Dormibacteraeota bacterium]|nr:hypothetical protein [Candidatus Dormibacteraeota bacterium]